MVDLAVQQLNKEDVTIGETYYFLRDLITEFEIFPVTIRTKYDKTCVGSAGKNGAFVFKYSCLYHTEKEAKEALKELKKKRK